MDVLLDHLAYQWISHRPVPELFSKRAVIITQCIGAGASSAARDIKHSLSWWGISKIGVFTGKLMHDIVWDKLPEKKKTGLTRKIQRLSKQFAQIDYTKPARTNLKTKVKFFACRMIQKSVQKSGAESLDSQHWAAHGWLGKARPWR